MTEPIDVQILNALLTNLTTPSLGYPIAMPLVPYTPVVGTPYLLVWPIMRTEPQSIGIDYAGPVLRRGILQIDAVTPDTLGEPPGLRIAAQVAARFDLGTKLVLPSRYLLKINKKPIIAKAIKDAAWVRYPVSIQYTLVSSS